MKKYFITSVLAIVLICSCLSCDKYLAVDSPSTVTETSVFSNLDFASKALYGVYNGFDNSEIFTEVILANTNSTDIQFTSSATDGGRGSVCTYSANDANSTLMNEWRVFYLVIERSNTFIANISKSPIWVDQNAKEAKKMYGEVVTLRALAYYFLVTTFGDVPFPTQPTGGTETFYLPKTNRDEIYEYLIEDLRKVEDWVPWSKETGTNIRVSKGFVKGLRARMALAYAGFSLRNKTHLTERGRYWQDYYKIANHECSDIINSGQHKLIPTFEGLFRDIQAYKQDADEVIFAKSFAKGVSGYVAGAFGMSFNAADTKYGKCSPAAVTSPWFYYSFDNADLRRDVSCELYDYSTSTSTSSKQTLVSQRTLRPTKWRRSWLVPLIGSTEGRTGVDWPVLRYADVLLMFAETQNEIYGAPTDSAKWAFKEVRKRAFPELNWPDKVDGYISKVSVGKQEFFDALVNERAWEFMGEGVRKDDLIRWNLLGQKIQYMRDENAKLFSGTDPNYQNVPDYIYWKYDTDGEHIIFLNKDYRITPTGTNLAGWTKTAWFGLSSQAASNISAFMGSVNAYAIRSFNGFDISKNNHLYPISGQYISSSHGMLNNDQMP